MRGSRSSRLAALRGALALAAALAAGLPAAAVAQAAPPAKAVARAPLGAPVSGLVVQLKDAPSREAAQALGASAGARENRLGYALRGALLAPTRIAPTGPAAQRLDFERVLSRDEAEAMARRLRTQPDVAWVALNTRERRLAAPNDPYYQSGEQWWLQAVRGSDQNAIADRLRGVPGFATAWDRTTGAPGAVVAVLDTGITTEPELSGRVVAGYDFVSTVEYANDGNGRDADPSDPGDWVTQAEIDGNPALFGGCTAENSSWHGTNIAALIAAVTDNASGVAAINWGGQIMPLRVAGKCGADASDIVAAIYYAAGVAQPGVPVNPHPARVINISFGGSAACDANYQNAIDAAAAAGAVVVAAAGNEQGALTRPANCRGVIAVGAVNRDGFKSNYSNFGSGITLMTVGGDPPQDGVWGSLLGDSGLLTLDNTGKTAPGGQGYARLYGTSFSTPLVSGAISLMLSVNANLSAAQIVEGLKLSARPHVTSTLMGVCTADNPGRCICTTSTCGAGLLDAAEATRYAADPAGYMAPSRPKVFVDNAEVQRAVKLGADAGAGAPPPVAAAPGGGGALDARWLLALALAVAATGIVSRGRMSRR